MRRVVVTGMGIVSCLGNELDTVSDALAAGRSGIRAMPDYPAAGLRSHVAGVPQIVVNDHIDRRDLRFMGDAAAFAAIALARAIAASGLTEAHISDPRTGLIAGTGGGSPANVVEAADTLRTRGLRKVGATRVPRTMCSTVAACLATSFHIKGVCYSLTSACATSAHCIGAAAEQIRWGNQDVMFCGGGEEEHWSLTALFDAMGALSTARNATPSLASRAYDVNRDGFVIASGGGMLVLESLEHAQARGAPVIAELVGFGVTADGADMVQPSGEGAVRCMRQALTGLSEPVDYVNAHGTSTPLGDVIELNAMREVFGFDFPLVSSTKSLSGHSLGAAGVQEAIYSLLMLRDGFLAGSANIDEVDPNCADYPILKSTRQMRVTTVMSNSFGFGGTNASLVFRRL
ncbi:MAG TPA: beta-ketoacyl synthase N-terminal-like domain-containing protein [Steroidobacteraceae bacterium]|nr:beta-ketoacyl synthase N-terminal-like domain-containing protein [Steroidobacteraceae bacterium]HRX90240.1 beta-ketoacyl synthase N-terminal-like domain-containing protein [Steroidobacteraceae bacterium]